MKYILSIGVIALLAGGVFWYTSTNDAGLSRHMDMMTGQTESDLTKLPDYAVEEVKPT